MSLFLYPQPLCQQQGMVWVQEPAQRLCATLGYPDIAVTLLGLDVLIVWPESCGAGLKLNGGSDLLLLTFIESYLQILCFHIFLLALMVVVEREGKCGMH